MTKKTPWRRFHRHPTQKPFDTFNKPAITPARRGLAPQPVPDQHFAHRRRIERLLHFHTRQNVIGGLVDDRRESINQAAKVVKPMQQPDTMTLFCRPGSPNAMTTNSWHPIFSECFPIGRRRRSIFCDLRERIGLVSCLQKVSRESACA